MMIFRDDILVRFIYGSQLMFDFVEYQEEEEYYYFWDGKGRKKMIFGHEILGYL